VAGRHDLNVVQPLIIYISGLLPKPEPGPHRDALLRCLLAGLHRVDAPVADAIERTASSFDMVSWTYDFYGRHRDIGIDRDSIAAVVEQAQASAQDIREASAWTRRLTRWIYRLGDLLPFLIPHLASERLAVHLRDLMRYEHNKNGIADRVRRLLKVSLLAAAGSQRPILLIAHSMGSVIAYDSLWELSHDHGNAVQIDLLLTMGSPLGQRFMQKRIKGNDERAADRYPANIRRWTNLTAVGDLTALDPHLANDFAEMVRLGLVDEIEDVELLNYFRLDGELNVHSEYGYLANDKTARAVASWWRAHASNLQSR